MRTKNARAIDTQESAHIARVKACPCGVCGAAGPSDAHHIEQGQHFTVIPLCRDCHQGSDNGWHGRRCIWLVMKLDPLKVLNQTIRRLYA